MFDHTNGATWSEEELDPTHTDVEGFQAEEHDDDATVQFITDYSNVGEWQEEQVDDDNENDATHQDGAWVEDIKTFDHSNVGSWEEVQVADDHDSHNNVVEWQAEVIDTEPAATNDWHENVASSDWVEHDGQDVSHDDQSAWIAEEVDENGWSEAHTNQGPAAAPESDLEWHVDEVHSNGGEWLDESGHANDVPDHTDAAPFIEAEIEALVSDDENSPHSDSSEGWYAEPAHSNDASVGKVGTGRMPSLDQSTHDNDGTIPVMPAEALIAKW
ncbi:hypothetical protein BDB00DRAFT_808635 [Zychaea mexicana]|uniref:uncharacterized protein n=1 Tax=Zychaea mexicana TaxID=64656 RepID=UPI0022FF2F4E|nr:uncharacterized protein BDB00DRAFT_808635 [Zychaea mexicana]KAI9496380.1 hypothetical protein BDB00DRAFT_808635 [Zychaea mexicana]